MKICGVYYGGKEIRILGKTLNFKYLSSKYGGGGGVAANLLYRSLIDFIFREDRSPTLQADDCVSLSARCNLDNDQMPSAKKPVVGGVELGRKFAVFGYSLRPVSRIMMRTKLPFDLKG